MNEYVIGNGQHMQVTQEVIDALEEVNQMYRTSRGLDDGKDKDENDDRTA